MKTAVLEHCADFTGWRDQARSLLAQNIDPSMINWQIADEAGDLFSSSESAGVEQPVRVPSAFRVPQSFMDQAKRVVCHSDPQRFALLYRVLWRMTHGESDVLTRCTDDDIHALSALAKAVSRDRHKMTAFVRFRKTGGMADKQQPEHYSAWFEPSHHILRLTTPFFCKRFSNMNWSIYTPEGSAHWNGKDIVYGAAGTRGDIPQGEVMEDLWRTYFANIFNPARLRIAAMQSEMPVKYWKNLPEAPLIAELIHASGRQTQNMVEAAPTQAPRYTQAALSPVAVSVQTPVDTDGKPVISKCRTIEQLSKAARSCNVCAHACDATQTVFGQGSESARIMIVGEQPGDIEDVRGRPFVGPSGKLIRRLLAELSLDEDEIYFTNAVKHFKYTVKGKRRIHQNPSADEIEHCRTWLAEELNVVKPALVIALGGSAARALLGRSVKIEQERGQLQRFGAATQLLITSHPAFVLRAISQRDQREREIRLKNDMALAVRSLTSAVQKPLALSHC